MVFSLIGRAQLAVAKWDGVNYLQRQTLQTTCRAASGDEDKKIPTTGYRKTPGESIHY